MLNARVARVFVASFMAAALCASSVQAQKALVAQEPTVAPVAKPKPFKLKVQKHQEADPADAVPLRISRDELNAGLTMPPLAPDLRKLNGAQIDPGDFALRAQDGRLSGSASFVKTLAKYDIELIVDESMSMRKRDCPGGMSRWQWCGMQLSELSNQLVPYAPQGFTLTTFASEFQTYQNAQSNALHQLFSAPQFSWGTRLSRPLNARLGSYFAHRSTRAKPLLLVVITDGVPAPQMEPFLVAQSLITATHQVSNPNEVKVVFLQVGGRDRRGRFFLDEMDNGLIANGARCDIVDTVTFEQLQQQGLTRALVASVSDFARQSSMR